MKGKLRNLVVLAGVIVGLSACGAPQTSATEGVSSAAGTIPSTAEAQKIAAPTDATMDKAAPTAELMDKAAPSGDAMGDRSQAAPEDAMGEKADDMMMAGWLATELIDVNTGQSFRIADLKGKVILVETMAVWCSTCLRQQREVAKLHERLGERDDFVSLAVDIDPNESADDLKAHASRHGFDWRYTVAGAAVAREIAERYGNQFVNPPSAPMLVIDRMGAVHPLPFGVKTAEALAEMLKQFLAQTM
jgi:hypothetical protein